MYIQYAYNEVFDDKCINNFCVSSAFVGNLRTCLVLLWFFKRPSAETELKLMKLIQVFLENTPIPLIKGYGKYPTCTELAKDPNKASLGVNFVSYMFAYLLLC